MLSVLINGEHDDLRVCQNRLEAAGAFNSTDTGQVDIHEDDVRFNFGNFLQRAFPAGVLTDTLVTRGTVNQAGQAFPHLGIVFNDGNRNSHSKGSRMEALC